jgi:subtilisin family serine protease
MQRRIVSFLLVLISLVSFTTVAPLPLSAAAPGVYVDPALSSAGSGSRPVIVQATSPASAAAAVRAVGGTITSELWLIDAVAARVPANSIGTLAAVPGVRSIVANHDVHSSDWDGWVTPRPLPDHWDGRPDVQPTSDPSVWRLVNPVTIDIGADVLHETMLPSGEPIRGEGVTVALVDSGVYFDDSVRAQLGEIVQRQFVGQADFVNTTCPNRRNGNGPNRVRGAQRDGYCWLGHHDTEDGYGHGTAIASIIWNNFREADTGVTIGVAPEASILSIRVLDDEGTGSYETVIKGIQFAVQMRERYDIRVLNLSLSAAATMPYFVDPLSRAVERAWSRGITVLVAAGNDGPTAESITAPGNNPYVITVGAVDENRTPGYWTDDFIPTWSAVGPTADGFIKPDIVAPGVNIITFMHSNRADPAQSQKIVRMHPDNSESTSLFRMSGTSMSTAISSGVVALMLQANPRLTPDQVKFRLVSTSRPALIDIDPPELVYSIFQQGLGRLWAPEAVLGPFEAEGDGNPDMRIATDVAIGYRHQRDLRFHYQGPVQRALSSDGQAYLYYAVDSEGTVIGLAAARADNLELIDRDALVAGRMAWSTGQTTWTPEGAWAGGHTLAAGRMAWSTGRMAWSTGRMAWSTGRMAWSTGRMAWSTGRMAWSTGRMAWSTGRTIWAGGLNWVSDPNMSAAGRMAWSTDLSPEVISVSTTRWVDEP